MRTFSCSCGNALFFENTRCVGCGSEVGWCPACRNIATLVPTGAPFYECGRPECRAALVKCHNYQVEDVCNRCLVPGPAGPQHGALCDYCRYNDTIPDLSVPGNRPKWYRLEQAKRRLLYTLDLLALPYGKAEDGVVPGLSFDFKQDPGRTTPWWWALGEEERVFTGHARGKITINLREADAVEREKARVAFAETHRTVIGHFRHEIGHYYYEMLVAQRRDDEFRRAFGDPGNPDYSAAQERYYREGPPAEWRREFISAYAAMHPWEDFAETFGAYLDMVSVLDTAFQLGFSGGADPRSAAFDDRVRRYQNLGVMLNEMNRAMGLTDLVPEVFVPAAVEKLRFVDRVAGEVRRP